MEIKTLIRIDDVDGKGNLIKRGRTKLCHSLVEAYIGCITNFNNATVANIKDVTNTNRTLNAASLIRFNAALNDASFGVVCGTGINVVAVTDFALQTQIANGVGAGQLQHSTVDFPDRYVIAAPDCLSTVRRTFTNNSGATITVNEFGLYNKDSVGGFIFCLDRTLSTKIILNTNGITVTYTWLITV